MDDKDPDVFCELLLKSSMILQIKIGALLALSLGTMVITMLFHRGIDAGDKSKDVWIRKFRASFGKSLA